MQKIGIISHFYGNQNYGGILQAYALVTFLNNKCGFNAEQICFEMDVSRFCIIEKNKIFTLLKYFNPWKYYNRIRFYIIRAFNKIFIDKYLLERKKSINKFADSILHSKKSYRTDCIRECNADYDCFITGSDQVWNLDWFSPAFFLEFANSGKVKIAYAASVGHSCLSEDRISYFKNVLPTFNSISVREKDAVDLLQPFSTQKIKWVLDPTLLLEVKDWEKICSGRRVKEKYLFCYFLGRDKKIRKLAKEYAKKHGLKIVNLPHLNGFCKADLNFGSYILYDIAPNDFISLIKYSECVFTDSFHACVFSGIFHKNFFVFKRKGLENASGRLYSLCELFDCLDHFCDKPEMFSSDYIESLEPINYQKDFKLLKEMKEQSIQFLHEALNNKENNKVSI